MENDYGAELFAHYQETHLANLDTDAASKVAWFKRYIAMNYTASLQGIDPAAAQFLEIGCSGGFLLTALSEAGWKHLTGIDLSPADIESAKQRLPGATLACVGAQEHCEAHAGRYDVILLKAVLEHVPKPAVLPLLRTMRAALKPGGRVLIDVPNMDWLFASHERYMDFTHEGGFTKESLGQLMRLVYGRVELHDLEMPGPEGGFAALKRSFARAVLRRLLAWADPESGGLPLWSRALLGVGYAE